MSSSNEYALVHSEKSTFQWKINFDTGESVSVDLIADLNRIEDDQLFKIQKMVDELFRIEHDLFHITLEDIISENVLSSDLENLCDIDKIISYSTNYFIKKQSDDFKKYSELNNELINVKENLKCILIFKNIKPS